jgi:serine/threonine protein phosphatase PrpC
MADPLVRSVARSHVGLVRSHNEDSYLDRPDIGLWVVADGMGGMTAGDVASRLIVETLDEIEQVPSAAALLQQVRMRVRGANEELRELAASRGAATAIGSTIAGLIVHSGYFACFWAGDSRVYRSRAGELDRLTRDHSLVQDMVDAGLLQPDQAEQHPNASVIQRAVGVDDDVKMEVVHARVQPGDRFLLCSDGLTRMVSDEEIEVQLAQQAIEQACDRLLSLVLERGAKDNVTIVMVELLGSPQ